MIEVIQRQVRYKAVKYSGVSEDEISEAFTIFSENGNLIQQELIQALILNFDLLDEVNQFFIYSLLGQIFVNLLEYQKRIRSLF
jgi:hypothetical protein